MIGLLLNLSKIKSINFDYFRQYVGGLSRTVYICFQSNSMLHNFFDLRSLKL